MDLAAEGHALVVAEGGELLKLGALAVRNERLRLARVVVAAQRIALEFRVEQDAAEIAVAAEHDAEHVERLALEPAGGRPHVDERIELDALFAEDVADARLRAQPVLLRERVEMAHDLEPGLAIGVIDAAEIGQHDHLACRIVAEEAVHLDPSRRLDDDGVVAVLARRLEDRLAEGRLELFDQRLAHGKPPSLFMRAS